MPHEVGQRKNPDGPDKDGSASKKAGFVELHDQAQRDDRSGKNPLVPNDQLRFLLGYEWEARPNFTVGLQYMGRYDARNPNPGF